MKRHSNHHSLFESFTGNAAIISLLDVAYGFNEEMDRWDGKIKAKVKHKKRI